ncbi:enamine deaminase RidA (YjgF/YER057c/UK114 family) [Paraburkholderia sp. BL6665CI2N2]|uniref:RidA family protein n=1 Tax=Paraburkholderia sp. BL6665CI2N2 TaxID=1938806 RepID=UPI001064667F|nr:Rid family hydrolase [Paraburkholderia sp. BL6665CI2N2]TDY17101.1 enamine deaminase RidA (YjgF/YER057c/UK114 family) [Paraburkholderia sp. BL6665CI2N2]
MFECVDTGYERPGHPISGVVRKGDQIFTVQIPTDVETGKLVNGGIEEQVRHVFQKLAHAMQAAGGSLADVMLVQVYLADPADWAPMHAIWTGTFKEPFPARATVVVKQLMLEGMRIEIVVNAHLG